MSYEDSFEREASDERAYLGFESWYIRENLQPQNIGKWEWRLMFNQTHSYFVYAEAVRDAKEMASELGRCVKVQSIYEGCFVARPDDYYRFPEGSSWTTYASRRADFIKALVIEGRYPDLVKIASETDNPDKYGISCHYFDSIAGQHQRWKGSVDQPTNPLSSPIMYKSAVLALRERLEQRRVKP